MSFTRLSKVLSALLVVGYAVQFFFPATPQYLALVPGRFLPCVWNIFTAGLLETHAVKLLGAVAALLFLARRIEPVWGSREFLGFLCGINASTGAATLALCYLTYLVNAGGRRAGSVLYMEISGFQGIIAACLVAVKQVMPEDEITVLSFIRFRAKHLSFMYVAVMCLAAVLLHRVMTTIPSVLFATYFAWAYLRFLQPHSGTLGRGDPSESFRLATLFPEPVHPVIDRLTAVCGSRTSVQDSSQEGLPFLPPSPAGEDAEAKRRRDRGARALEARLGNKRAPSASPPPGDGPGEVVVDVTQGSEDRQ